MQILVTGAAGFIGSHLSERLVALGHIVYGVDCLSDFYSRHLKQLNVQVLQAAGVDVQVLDLAADDLSETMREVEIIFHLAAQPGLSATASFETYVRNNFLATHALLEAAKRAPRLRGFINISTSSVYGSDATVDETIAPQPISYYGVTKLAAEQLVMAYQRNQGLPACSLRLYSVYGPRERPDKLYPKLIHAILADEPFTLFEGSEHHQRSYTFVGDIVEGLVAVLPCLAHCIGEIFNIGTDHAITTGEGIRIVEEILGKRARIERKTRRTGDQERTRAIIEKARRVLGYQPRTMPREGLAQEVQWYREQIWGRDRA